MAVTYTRTWVMRFARGQGRKYPLVDLFGITRVCKGDLQIGAARTFLFRQFLIKVWELRDRYTVGVWTLPHTWTERLTQGRVCQMCYKLVSIPRYNITAACTKRYLKSEFRLEVRSPFSVFWMNIQHTSLTFFCIYPQQPSNSTPYTVKRLARAQVGREFLQK